MKGNLSTYECPACHTVIEAAPAKPRGCPKCNTRMVETSPGIVYKVMIEPEESPQEPEPARDPATQPDSGLSEAKREPETTRRRYTKRRGKSKR